MIPHATKLCILILVLVTLVSQAKLSPPWTQTTLNTSIENFITDPRSGSIFVAQGGHIWKYSDKFELLDKSQYANVTDNRILHLLTDQEFLLSCWQPQDLQCALTRIDSLNQSTDLFPLSQVKNFGVGQNDKVRVTTIRNDAIEIVVSFSRLAPVEPANPTQTTSHLAQPALGRFKIHKKPGWLSEQLSVLTYKDQFSGQNLIYDYIYAFNHNQYIYFMLNDERGGRRRVRLARVCDGDTQLTSYIELTMACNKKDDLSAKYAFFDITKDEPTLYVAFEHTTDGKPTKKSTLICTYDMNLADNYVHNAVRECNIGASDLSLLAKFNSDFGQHTISEQPCQRNPSDERGWCTSKLNTYINGTLDKYKLNTDIHINIDGMVSVNFLHTFRQGEEDEEKEIFFIGTETGYLTKLSSDEYLLYSVDLAKSTIKSYHHANKYSPKSTTNGNSEIIRYAVDSLGIIAVSADGKLNRLDPYACYYYTSCDSCLDSKDPLGCVWCDQTCSRKQNCEKSKRFTKSCPPSIRDFEPKNGTLSGSTLLKIEGSLFGSTKGDRTVKLGDKACEINNELSNDTVIYCLTPPVNATQGVNLSIDVVDVLGSIDLKGNATAKDLYRYILEPQEARTSIVLILVMAAFAIIIILITIVRFSRGSRFMNLREKIWPTIEPRPNDNSHIGVSYRVPQPDAKLAGNSINELVKLDGSMMSSGNYFMSVNESSIEQPLMKNLLDNDLLSLLKQEKILIDRKLLTLGHVLGSGQFGRVYKGFLLIEETGEHVAVAVKTIHNKSMYDDALDNGAFVEEGLMMKDFEHENVLTLIGVTVDSSGLPMVVTPFMLYGDLRSYISDEASSPTVRELIDFGTQIAKGMAYLANLKFVHRDLAARNCMLDENLTVKVADFGLSRDIYERDYYSSENKKTKLPVKWMAIESLERCIYSTKTDVWSYGVLLWELMTRGVVPYPDVDNFDLFSYLKEGRRMMRPRYCPEILYGIMLSCWQENPNDRPTFDELVQKVSAVITNLQIAKDGQQTVSRDETYCDAFKRPM